MDEEKLAYWKKRITDHILSHFRDTKDGLKPIIDDMQHIGCDKEEMDQAIMLIGEGFDALKGTVEHRMVKKDQTPGKPVVQK